MLIVEILIIMMRCSLGSLGSVLAPLHETVLVLTALITSHLAILSIYINNERSYFVGINTTTIINHFSSSPNYRPLLAHKRNLDKL